MACQAQGQAHIQNTHMHAYTHPPHVETMHSVTKASNTPYQLLIKHAPFIPTFSPGIWQLAAYLLGRHASRYECRGCLATATVIITII